MKIQIAFLLILPFFVLFSCGGEEEDPVRKPVASVPKPLNSNTISTDFLSNEFTGNGEEELLKELQICDPKAANDTDEKLSACSPKFFRFFPLTKAKPLKDAFMVMVKAGVGGFPSRRLLIFEREQGRLVKLNGFTGYLIERRNSASGYDDIVVRFGERIDGNLYFYNCLFVWKEGRYEYKNCEAINDSRIKAEYIDSMAVEIKQALDEKNYLF